MEKENEQPRKVTVLRKKGPREDSGEVKTEHGK
jgi:hypothetical protein